MNKIKCVFHMVSYLQYPLLVISMIQSVLFAFSVGKNEPNWEQLNNMLILLGVALSFSTLQDTSKTQNKLSRDIWKNPKKGANMLILMFSTAFILICIGLSMLYFSKDDNIANIGVGITVLGIGFIGLLKTAIEMFEHHRVDKNIVADGDQT